jgi:uncharacterized protein YndB with AHSA1/START domain
MTCSMCQTTDFILMFHLFHGRMCPCYFKQRSLVPEAMATQPDLSSRPFQLTVERNMAASPHALFLAWTQQFDRWFAAPGTVLMKPEEDAPFFFETRFGGQRHPHYGRFLKLVPDQFIELTWVTGEGGTEGAETIVSVELTPQESGAHLKLVHKGFSTGEAKSRHENAWPLVLAQLDERIAMGTLQQSGS